MHPIVYYRDISRKEENEENDAAAHARSATAHAPRPPRMRSSAFFFVLVFSRSISVIHYLGGVGAEGDDYFVNLHR